MKSFAFLSFVLLAVPALAAEPPLPAFRAVDIDTKIEIGYGVTVADVDGDKKPDIILADKHQIVWYRNPTWEKFVIAENLTTLDDVCVAATDIDGDGKAEIAVGAGWNPGDTVNSGAVFYLIPPADRTQKWTPVELPHEPTVHRMRWVKNATGKFDLVVVPLHGRGNKNGEGDGVKALAYKMPANPKDPWKTEVISDTLHMTHNFQPIKWSKEPGQELLIAASEGVFMFSPRGETWKSFQLIGNRPGETVFPGAGEVRVGKLPGRNDFIATVEPMHGNQMAVYTAPSSDQSSPLWNRNVLESSMREGHALACGDLLGIGSDQVVVGSRLKNSKGKVGIWLFTPLDKDGKDWRKTVVDEQSIACEDLCLADLDGDGKLDIIASGRATKNLRVYFNQTGAGAK
jgi:hypothetical protein